MTNVGVVLLNMGGPQTGSEVKPFLKAMFDDPDLIPLPAKFILAPLIITLRAPVARRHYAMIEGGSPLLSTSLAQAAALEQLLNETSTEFMVRVGMRYTSPSIEETIDELTRAGCERIVALSMYPQYCKATTGSSMKELERVMGGRESPVDVRVVDRYFDDGDYIEAVATTVRDAMDPMDSVPFVLFSAHGVPTRMVEEGDPYVEETKTSVKKVAQILELEQGNWKLAFQSRVGPVKWVEPYSDQVVAQLAKSGINNLLFVPISFTVDNLETLYDIKIVLAQKARSLGIAEVSRAKALNVAPAFIGALANMVGKALSE